MTKENSDGVTVAAALMVAGWGGGEAGRLC